MKNLLLLVLFTFLVSNTSVKKEDDSLPQKVTITGKIHTYRCVGTYKTNFMVLAHPGDSIHVVFDGIRQCERETYRTA